MPAEDCIAIEDSENGLKSATAAGIKTIITTSEYTRQQDFNNAALVLEDLENVMIASHNEPLSVQTLINLNRRTPI
ncbi:hypothetical protein [Nitrosomonas eutropha]|uniref:hypothetical protein n=1 Tax=Nitrosomonas eutropha TaxID=916 RepID=UPI0030F3BE57